VATQPAPTYPDGTTGGNVDPANPTGGGGDPRTVATQPPGPDDEPTTTDEETVPGKPVVNDGGGGGGAFDGLPVPPYSMPDEAIIQWQIDMGYRNPDGSVKTQAATGNATADNPQVVVAASEAPRNQVGDGGNETGDGGQPGDVNQDGGQGGFMPGFDSWGTENPAIEPTGIGIQGENIRDVAGASQGQIRAGNIAGTLGAQTEGERAAWSGLGNLFGQQGRMASGSGMMTDPGVNAAFQTFMNFGSPMIQDEYSAMGLGRSDAKGSALGLGLASMMQPATQDYLAREGAMIDRDVGIADRGISHGLNIGAQDVNRRATAFGAESQVGETQRAIEQERRDAPYEDFMRRAALGESVLTGPFGGLVPSVIGSKVTSSGGK
jgi:hypothetical protein